MKNKYKNLVCKNECRNESDVKKSCGQAHYPFVCTRDAGHKGKHVACSTIEHKLDEW